MIHTSIKSHDKDPQYHTVSVHWVLAYGEQLPEEDMMLELATEAALKATKKVKGSDEETPMRVVVLPQTGKIEFTGTETKLIAVYTVEGYTQLSMACLSDEEREEAEEPVDVDTHAIVLGDTTDDVWGFVDDVRALSSGFPLLPPGYDSAPLAEVLDTTEDAQYMESMIREAFNVAPDVSLGIH